MTNRARFLIALPFVALVWIAAERSAGDPWRSRAALILLMAGGYLAGQMREILRPNGTLHLIDRLAQDKAALERIYQRAHVEADVGAPAGMVAVYVEAEVRHYMNAHHGDAQECTDCYAQLGNDRPIKAGRR